MANGAHIMSKNRILIVDKEGGLAPYLEMSLKAEIAHPFELAKDQDSAEALLKQFDDIGLIVGTWSLKDDEQAMLATKSSLDRNIPCILVSRHAGHSVVKKVPGFLKNTKNSLIDYRFFKRDFGKKMRHALEDYAPLEEFQIISFPLLMRFGSLGHEVFHRLQVENRFIALNQKYEDVDLPKILSFRNEKHHLYMRVDQYKEYLQKVIDLLLDKKEDVTVSDNAVLTTTLLFEKYKQFGITEESFKETRELLGHFVRNLRPHKTLLKNLSWLKQHHDYRQLVCTLTITLVVEVAKKLGLDNDKFREKMCYAALFQDMNLKDNYISLIRKEDILYLDIQDAEKEEILRHPLEASKQLSRIPQIPSDTLTIIEQHHEMPDGSGYPRGLTFSHIHAASCLYITCYHVAHQMIKNLNVEDESLTENLEAFLELYFSAPKFEKYKMALGQIFRN